MEKDKFKKAIGLNNQRDYLLKVKTVLEEDSVDLRGTSCRFEALKGNLLKRIREIVDEEICEVDQKIENL